MHLFTDSHTPSTMPWMLAGAILTHNDTRLCFSGRSKQSRIFMRIKLLVDLGRRNTYSNNLPSEHAWYSNQAAQTQTLGALLGDGGNTTYHCHVYVSGHPGTSECDFSGFVGQNNPIVFFASSCLTVPADPIASTGRLNDLMKSPARGSSLYCQLYHGELSQILFQARKRTLEREI